MIQLHTERKSKITASQINSKELMQRQKEVLRKRKEMLHETPGLNIYMEFPAPLMAKKKNSCDKDKEIERF